MALYNVFLIAGGAAIIFSVSNGIWNAIVPGKRESDVPMTYLWRVVSLVAGVVVFMTGFTILVRELC